MNLWWGYKHINGTLQIKRFFSQLDIMEAEESPFVEEYSGPYPADNREEALQKLKEKLMGPGV